jgi:galactonate dehydratase
VKITKVETILVGAHRLILRLHTDEGLIGLGEPFAGGRARSCATAIEQLESYLLGKDPRRVVHHWQGMFRHASHRGGWILTSALSGVEQALWDLAGKAAGLPVHLLLGGVCRDRVRMCGLVGGDTPDSAADSVHDSMAAGFTAGKMVLPVSAAADLPGHGPGRIVDIFAAMREAGGPGYDLAIDFGGRMAPQEALSVIRALEPHEPLYVAEPIGPRNVDGMTALSRQTRIPIAIGAHVYTKGGFQEILEKKAARIIQLNISRAGGISEGCLIAGLAQAHRVAVVLHSPPGPIGMAASLHLAACIPNLLVQESALSGEGDLNGGPRLVGGQSPVPPGHGLAVTLDDDTLAVLAEQQHHQGPPMPAIEPTRRSSANMAEPALRTEASPWLG